MSELRPLQRLAAIGVLAVCSLLAGCGQYTIAGKVIEGELSSARFVPADDPSVAVPGVGGASVSILRDPDTPKRTIAGSASADSLGLFEMPVEGVGAGWMVEDWLVRAERSGYAAAAARISLPANPRRYCLLITIRRGAGTPAEAEDREDLLREVERYR